MLSFGIVVCKNEGTGNLKHLPRFIGGVRQSFAVSFQKRGNRILHPLDVILSSEGFPETHEVSFGGS